CHVPGRAEHAVLADDEVEIGTGPHNEPGYKRLSPAPSAEGLVKMITDPLLGREGSEPWLHQIFNMGDETMLLISNFGGISPLEMGALTDEVLEQLASSWGIEPAQNCAYTAEEIKAFADVKTTTSWESMAGSQGPRRRRREQLVSPPQEPKRAAVEPTGDLRLDAAALDKMLRGACEALVQAKPDLTRWDTLMGDGDCGETLKKGATSLLAALDQKGIAASRSVVTVLREVEDIVGSKMGGTLGGGGSWASCSSHFATPSRTACAKT
ncbi:dihydroxyacetone kinase, partial [Diaporthe helianthi]